MSERFDTTKAHVHLGAPWPEALADYKMIPGYVTASGPDQRTWYRQLHKGGPEDNPVFVIRDFTIERGVPMSFLDGPMGAVEAFEKAPYLFPPCFSPMVPDEDAPESEIAAWNRLTLRRGGK